MEQDKSFNVQDNCQEPRDPPQSTLFQAQPFQTGVSAGFSAPHAHDYIDRTDFRLGKLENDADPAHSINLGALYRQPLDKQQQQQQSGNTPADNNNYLLGLLYK